MKSITIKINKKAFESIKERASDEGEGLSLYLSKLIESGFTCEECGSYTLEHSVFLNDRELCGCCFEKENEGEN